VQFDHFSGSWEPGNGLWHGTENLKGSRFKMKKLKKKFRFTVEKTTSGFSAYSNDYPVYTTGDSFTLLQRNAVEAVNLYLEGKSMVIDAENILFDIDLKQFFQYYRIINAKFLAKRIGMHETLLSQYIQGKRKPSEKQTMKILEGIREIGRELTNITLHS
jgi:transcriptional regulator with XRE-family HTH domain